MGTSKETELRDKWFWCPPPKKWKYVHIFFHNTYFVWACWSICFDCKHWNHRAALHKWQEAQAQASKEMLETCRSMVATTVSWSYSPGSPAMLCLRIREEEFPLAQFADPASLNHWPAAGLATWGLVSIVGPLAVHQREGKKKRKRNRRMVSRKQISPALAMVSIRGMNPQKDVSLFPFSLNLF